MKRRITDYFNKYGSGTSVTPPEIVCASDDSAKTADESSPDDEAPTSMAPRKDNESAKKTKFEHHFQSSWLATYPWLEYADSHMFCKICKGSKKQNAFTVGSNCFRTSTLKQHVLCTDHQNALREGVMRDNFSITARNAFTQKTDAIIAAMRCVYWLAKEGISTVKYPSLLEFCKLQGCEILNNLESGQNAKYTSWTAAEDMQDALASVIQSNIDKQLSESSDCAILIDESTDVTVSKKLVIYARIVDKDMCQHTHFLGNIRIDEASVTSSLIFEKLTSYLSSRGIMLDKIFGFGSDGASLMVGKKKGVATRLKQENPHLVSVHCFAHRLALCTSRAADNVPYINKTFEKTLCDLFYYFKKSTKRILELKAIQKVLEADEVRLKEVHDIRWFSFYNALYAIYLAWSPLVTYFKAIVKPTDAEKAFLKTLTDIRFLSMMHMLMDVIPPFTQLNILFQKENIDIAVVPAALEGALNKAKSAKKGHTHYQTEFKEKLKTTQEGDKTKHTFKTVKLSNKSVKDEMTEFEQARSDFIDNLCQNVERRFPKESTEIVFAFSVLGMRSLAFLSPEEVQLYGEKEMKILTDFYGSDQKISDKKSNAIIQTDLCLSEWSTLKQVVLSQRYPRDNLAILWKLIAQNHSQAFPNMIKLAKFALLMPLQTADCERWFSAQNNIHTPSRNALKPETLQRLMTIMIEGPSCEEFDFEDAVVVWKSVKDRRLFHN